MNTVFKDYIRVIEVAQMIAPQESQEASRIDLLQRSAAEEQEDVSVQRINREYEIKNPRTLFSHTVSQQPSMMQT